NYLYDKIQELKVKKKHLKGLIWEHQGSSYEIKNGEIYRILIGSVDPISYFENRHRRDSERYVRQQEFCIPIYDIINYLIIKGLPNEITYGQHAITKFLQKYLDTRENIKGIYDNYDGHTYYAIME